jgi:hypothetical protein
MHITISCQGSGDLIDPLLDGAGYVEAVLHMEARCLEDGL